MQSGIVPLDHQLGGIQRGRLHLLTGGPGAGKTTACLQFIQAGIRSGDAGLLLTSDRPADVASHARSVGLQLSANVRAGRLLVARYHAQCTSHLASTAARALIDELTALLAHSRPARVVIDPLTPLLGERSAYSTHLAAVAELLGECGATTILTYHDDVSGGYDARLGAIVQNAAAIVHMIRGEDGVRRMRVVQARWQPAPPADLRFTCIPGVGLVSMPDAGPVEVTLMAAPRPKRTRARKVSS